MTDSFDFDDEYNKGNPNLIYYRLFRFDPTDPDTLYSPVGPTWGNEDHVGTTKFSREGINVDIRGQGFWAESSPEGAARWLHVKAPDEGGGYHYDEKNPDSYAVFPVVGTPHNWQYFQEHPEVFSDFGVADGYIIDEMQIIGDPVYEWHNKNRDKVLQTNQEQKDYRALSNILGAIQKGYVDRYIELYKKDKDPEFLRQAERAIEGPGWEREYRRIEEKIAGYNFGWDESRRILEPTEINKQKARQLITLLKTL